MKIKELIEKLKSLNVDDDILLNVYLNDEDSGETLSFNDFEIEQHRELVTFSVSHTFKDDSKDMEKAWLHASFLIRNKECANGFDEFKINVQDTFQNMPTSEIIEVIRIAGKIMGFTGVEDRDIQDFYEDIFLSF